MNDKVIYILLMSFASFYKSYGQANLDSSASGYNVKLINLLHDLRNEDQKWRNQSTNIHNDNIQKDSVFLDFPKSKVKQTDSLNYFHLKNIITTYGFPDYDLVGIEGSHNFWLLVQHQDARPAFQDSVLVFMKSAVDKGKASSIDYAYLIDRVKINAGQAQVYGTQMQLNKDETSYEPKLVVDPFKLDERRKSVGMGTEQEYIDVMNKTFSGSLKKK